MEAASSPRRRSIDLVDPAGSSNKWLGSAWSETQFQRACAFSMVALSSPAQQFCCQKSPLTHANVPVFSAFWVSSSLFSRGFVPVVSAWVSGCLP